MTEKSILKRSEVGALRVVLITLLIIYGTILISTFTFMAKVFPSLLRLPSGPPAFDLIKFLFDRILPGAAFFFIGFSIFKLINLISRGEPFSPASPRHIRRIACAVFFLAAINVVVNVISVFKWPEDFLTKSAVWAICSTLSMLLLGLGFLVIARVLEVGVRIQQDQNLTV
ncbi:MAG: DUF2975 domain-containing protein [Candidatus Aminicenantes bacterium]|nr:DUF2975 domain-containing protein [Candidatus Aminicenantes bacterium]